MINAVDQSSVKGDFLALPEWSGIPEAAICELADLAQVVAFAPNATLTLIIKEPFHISTRVNVGNRDALARFLKTFRAEYRGYVQEAQQLAARR